MNILATRFLYPIAAFWLLVSMPGCKTDGPKPITPKPKAKTKSVILVPMPKTACWQDYSYLAAIPAATKANNGKPVVLAVDPYATLRPETKDFLRRYKPDKTYTLGDIAVAAPVTKGLAAYWPLGEGTGSGFSDSSGKLTGRVHRLPAWKTNKAEGYQFNGQTIEVVNGSAPGSSPELTVAFWMKADAVKNQVPIGKINRASKSPGWAILLRDAKQRNAVRFRIGSGGGAWFHSDLAVERAYKPGEWVHVACTFADGVSKVYLNGKLKGTRKEITWGTPNNTTNPLLIGSTGWEPFVGLMDELRIYNRALEPLEVERLPGAAGPTTRGLVGYWPLDEKNGKLAKDKADSTDLKLAGKAAWIKGHVGGAIRLNGKGDSLQSKAVGSTKPLTVMFHIMSNASQSCAVLNKSGIADQVPPWSFSLEKETLVFQIGDRTTKLRAPGACKPGKTVFVTAIYQDGTMSLALDGRVVASLKDVKWCMNETPFAGPRFDGELDKVRIYNIALPKLEPVEPKRLLGSWDLDQGLNQKRMLYWDRGWQKSGLLFDGRYVYGKCPAPAWKSDAMSVAFWVKPTAPGCILSRRGNLPADPGWSISLNADRQSLLFEVDGRKTGVRHAESCPLNQWTHVTCTYAKGISTIYLNGRVAHIRRGIKNARLKGLATPLRMGALLPGQQHFAGVLNDVRLYNRAVSENEALALFASTPTKQSFKGIPATNAETAAIAVARKFWKTADRVVCCSVDNYGDALVASALAARLRAPLLFRGKKGYSAQTLATLKTLGTSQVLVVGAYQPAPIGIPATALKDDLAVLEWMKKTSIPVAYLAAVNPQDYRIGQVRKTSLAGPLLAAGRNGAVAMLDFETQWKLPFDGKTENERVPGTPESKNGWRSGDIKLDGSIYLFVLTSTREKIFDQLSIYMGSKEYGPPLRTGDKVKLNGRNYTVSLHRKDGIGQHDFRLTWPSGNEVLERLQARYKAMGKHPEYLCVLGRPDVIPPAVQLKPQWHNEDLPTDIPYGEADKDPFSEIAVGRFVGETVYSATLIASRGLAYNDLLDPSWTGRCATTCWESLMDHGFQNVGFGPTVHHDGKKLFDHESPLRSVAGIAHAEHSGWMGLGGFVAWNSSVLLAPSVIETSGCSTMSLDRDFDARSAPVRLLRNGAVAVSGNVRLGIGQQKHYRTEFWNAVLAGKTVGQAHRQASNHVLLAVLEKKQTKRGGDVYQYYNRILYGDPAVAMYIPSKPKAKPAHTKVNGSDVTVVGPEKWWKYDEHIVKDWRYTKSPKLWAFRGAGVGTENRWNHKDRYGFETNYFVAEVRTKSPVAKVEQVTQTEKPLGWTGQFWTDMHQDGSRTILWRVRLIHADKPTGTIHSQVDILQFRLIE